jgi:HEAT repeat protein
MADPDPIATKHLLVELRDVNKETRRSAVMKLGMQGGEQAIRALIEVVQNPYEDLIVRGRAAQMLGVMGDNRAVDPLIRALNTPGYQAQLYAAEALGKLGSARAITPLLEVANDPSRDRVRSAAKTALTRLGWQNDVQPAADTPDEETDQQPSRIYEEF